MNIQINEDQLHVISEMIAIRGLSISPHDALMEMILDDINGIERTLNKLKEFKARQEHAISRPKLYLVK